MENLTFGQRIVNCRSKKKILQRELAEKMGMLPTTLSRYEHDIREPDVATIVKIANALEITADELLGIDTSNSPLVQNSDEMMLLRDYRSLNKEGQEIVLDYIDTLARSGKYIKNSAAGMGESAPA
jgi:transcriptional regulator with XRE-family HTH domain